MADRYARANVFVGAYQVPTDGHVRLPESTRVRIVCGVVSPLGWRADPLGEPWLIVDDGRGFWPVMVRLSEADDDLCFEANDGFIGS